MNTREITTAFETLLQDYKAQLQSVVSKEELAAKEKEVELLNKARTYTPNNIVKGLGELQLSFTDNLSHWTKTLQEESEKRTQIREALTIEKRRLEKLKEIKLAADMLYLLKEVHQKKCSDIEQQQTQELQALEEKKVEKHKVWQRQRTHFEEQKALYAKKTEQERQHEEELFAYETKRKEVVENDAFTESQRLLEQQLADTQAQKQKDWNEREAKLKEQDAKHEKNQASIAEFEEKLKAEVAKSREKAAAEASKEAKNQAELVAKEEEANSQIFTQQIADMQERTAKNKSEIETLSAQLVQAVEQVKSLSVKALENSKVA
jgi:hypothetical protein